MRTAIIILVTALLASCGAKEQVKLPPTKDSALSFVKRVLASQNAARERDTYEISLADDSVSYSITQWVYNPEIGGEHTQTNNFNFSPVTKKLVAISYLMDTTIEIRYDTLEYRF